MGKTSGTLPGKGLRISARAPRRSVRGQFRLCGQPLRIGFQLLVERPARAQWQAGAARRQNLEEEINAAGGLLGRKVELVNYDDQSNPSNVPGIYAKLLDVDKVDLIMGPYGTNMVAPAIPVVMPKGKVIIGLFALDANREFNYPRYFSMIPYGPDPKVSNTEGLLPGRGGAESEAGDACHRLRGRRIRTQRRRGRPHQREKNGMKVIYDKTFPPGTTDFSPVIRAVRPPMRTSWCSLLSAEFGRAGSVRERAWA